MLYIKKLEYYGEAYKDEEYFISALSKAFKVKAELEAIGIKDSVIKVDDLVVKFDDTENIF